MPFNSKQNQIDFKSATIWSYLAHAQQFVGPINHTHINSGMWLDIYALGPMMGETTTLCPTDGKRATLTLLEQTV